jgi:anaerobic ribonucleoside-triphosphate reductase activating protein
MKENLFLNIATSMARSRANGPGVRAVIWVQGCTIGCPGCYNNFTHPHTSNKLSSPSKIVEWINSIDDIEGITFSGGEPFEQALAVSSIIEKVNSERQEPLTIFIFTGFDFETLNESKDTAVKRLLSMTDILSAGPYVSSLKEEQLLWRGSTNQELIYLTDTYSSSEEEKWIRNSPIEELVMSDTGIMRTGFRAKKGDLYNSLVNI